VEGPPRRGGDRLIGTRADGPLILHEDLDRRLAGVPSVPGCYVFRNAAGDEIYVGKAKSLRRRVASYFRRGGGGQAIRTTRLVEEIHDWLLFETDSEVEALLLENELIKDLQPIYNVRLKDDKDYPLLAITREEFPRVFITRDRDLEKVDYVGPFGSATELRKAYHFLMRAFQFRNCELDIRSDDPVRRHFRPCLNYHIKRCSAPCTTRIDAAAYGADIRALRAFLSGRGKKKVVGDLTARMEVASDERRYEDAARYRDQLRAIARLRERGSLKDYGAPAAPIVDPGAALDKIATALGLAARPRTIEGFDIAHLQGTHVVASMVQFLDGVPHRDGYRRFKVRGDGTERNDDFAAMREVVGRRYRRLRDEGRPLPDLVLIDGGLGQVHAARDALDAEEVAIPCLVGLAKKEETLVRPDGEEIRLTRRDPGLKLLMFVRDEAHRFCRRYYHLLQRKGLDA